MRIAVATLLAALTATPASAQPSLAEVCQDADMPTRAEYHGNPTAYADNFCALAMYAPNRAARQFDSMVSLVRAHNNPNRHYWDRRYEPTAEYLQLLRPWMAEGNLRVVRYHPEHGVLGGGYLSVPVVAAGVEHSNANPWMWIGRQQAGPNRHRYAVMFMSYISLIARRYDQIVGLDALFALITRSGDIERINFMSSDVYWHWINDRRNEVDGRGEPDSNNVTRTVHAALDCLGRDGAIASAITQITTNAQNVHFSCEMLAE